MEMRSLAHGITVPPRFNVASVLKTAATAGTTAKPQPADPVNLTFSEIAGEATVRKAVPNSFATKKRQEQKTRDGQRVVTRRTFTCRKCKQPKTAEYGHRQYRGHSFCPGFDQDYDTWVQGITRR